jgi:hypothetical protein
MKMLIDQRALAKIAGASIDQEKLPQSQEALLINEALVKSQDVDQRAFIDQRNLDLITESLIDQ